MFAAQEGTVTPDNRRTEARRRYATGLPALGLVVTVAVLLGLVGTTIGILVAVALLVSSLIFVHADVATIDFVFVIYLNVPTLASDLHGVPPSISQLVVLLLLIPMVRELFFRRQPLVVTHTLLLALVFFAVMLLSAAVASRPPDTIAALETTLLEGLLLFFLVTNAIRDTFTLRRVFWAVIAAGVVMAGVTVFQQATGSFENEFGGLSRLDLDSRGIKVDEGPLR